MRIYANGPRRRWYQFRCACNGLYVNCVTSRSGAFVHSIIRMRRGDSPYRASCEDCNSAFRPFMCNDSDFPSPPRRIVGGCAFSTDVLFFLFTTTNVARKRPRIPKSVAGHLSAKSAICNNTCVGNIYAVSLDKLHHAVQIRVTRWYGRRSLFTVKERFDFNDSIKHQYRKLVFFTLHDIFVEKYMAVSKKVMRIFSRLFFDL